MKEKAKYILFAVLLSIITIAISHWLQPEISFYGDQNGVVSRLNRKFTVYAGTEIPLNDAISMIPRVFMMKQGEHLELTGGANFRTLLNDYSGIALHFGGWLRTNRSIDKFINPEAFVVLAGIEYNRILFGFSYDVNLGSLTRSTGRQAFEFSLGYLGEHEEEGIVCPKF